MQDCISPAAITAIKQLIAGKKPLLASAHAFERHGVNAIPEALADELGNRTGLAVDNSIVQINIVSHTGAKGFDRLARQAMFDGDVQPGKDYFLVDDFIGQGGTLANLKGFIEFRGGHVIGATALTGKPYSAKLQPSPEQLAALKVKHGQELENWWQQYFGHGFDCLTQSEARYLEHTADVDTIRDRLATAKQTGNRGALP